MTRPYGTPTDCAHVGWEHHWMPILIPEPDFVGQICASCEMIRIPDTAAARLDMMVENADFVSLSSR